MGSFKLLRESELPLGIELRFFWQRSQLVDAFRYLAVVSEERTWQRGRLQTMAFGVRLSVVKRVTVTQK